MKSSSIALFWIAALCVLHAASSLNLESEWKVYMGKYRKRYSSSLEEARRKSNYIRALEKVEKHNKMNLSWAMGVNQFSDMLAEEKLSILGSRLPDDFNTPKNYLTSNRFGRQAVKSELDLREDSCMPPIKDQGMCGSCYAFTAVTPLEYLYCKQENSSTLFSDQQLVDCDPRSDGCGGGWYTDSWEYLRTHGLMTSASYPYESGVTQQNGTCRFDESRTVTVVKEYYYVQPSAVHMALALNYYGPLAVAFVAMDDFFAYSSGIYSGESCIGNATVNHGVVIVGYGTDPDHGAYWVVRNSWGECWGLKGYALVKRGVNTCMIESHPAFPVLP